MTGSSGPGAVTGAVAELLAAAGVWCGRPDHAPIGCTHCKGHHEYVAEFIAASRLLVPAAEVAREFACPHATDGRHYYAVDATCQRCEMPSWVEALGGALLARLAPGGTGTPTTGAVVPERQRCICDGVCVDHCRACNHSGRDLEEPCIADPDWEPDDDDLARRTGGTGTTEAEAHVFVGVAGHPDDDECTYRPDGTDATYCGRPEAEHDEDPAGAFEAGGGQ